MNVSTVIGVLAGCGGAGASTFAAVLAAAAAPAAFLLDCDPLGGGIDILLGCERTPGPRWGQVRLRGGWLDPAVLRDGLPRWGTVRFLAAEDGRAPDPECLGAVIDAARLAGTVVLDLPRQPGPARTQALSRCDLLVLVVPAEVRAVAASSVVRAGLADARSEPGSAGLVVRGSSKALPATRVGQLLTLPVLAPLPHDPAVAHPAGLQLRRLRRASRAAAVAVLSAGSAAGFGAAA